MTWDEYFLKICNAVSENSKCLSRKIGAIIVKDHSIISTGFNGPSRGIPHCGLDRFNKDKYLRSAENNGNYLSQYSDETINTTCPRQLLGFVSGRGLEYCIASHAERNAIINAARHGIKTKGTKMYMTCSTPCHECLKEIINAGIEEVIITSLDKYDEASTYLMENSDLRIRTFVMEAL